MRLFVLVLSLLLVLCGCDDIRDNTAKQSFFIEGGLPEIGEFSKGQVKNYYQDTVRYEISPVEGVDVLIPFIGSSRKFFPAELSSFGFGTTYHSYGFCLSSGDIVFEANDDITSCKYISDGDYGVYELTIQLDSKQIDDFGSSKTVILSEDGLWMVELGRNGTVYMMRDGYIFTRSFVNGVSEPALCLVYDYKGNHVFTFDDGLFFMSFSNSMFLVRNTDDEMYYFLNTDGSIKLGPYLRTYPFNSEGYTFALSESGNYSIIDTDGNIKSSGDWYDVDSVVGESESAFVCYSGKELNKADIYSAAGEYISSIQSEREIIENVLLFFAEDNDIIYTYDNWASNWKRLSTGERFVSRDLGVCPNSIDDYDGYFFYRNDVSKSGALFDEKGKTVVKSSNMDYVLGVSDRNGIVIYRADDSLYVYDINRKKNILTKDTADAYAAFSENERYLVVTFDGKSNLFDIEREEYVFENALFVSAIVIDGKTYFNVVTNTSSTLYDEDKNVMVRVLIDR